MYAPWTSFKADSTGMAWRIVDDLSLPELKYDVKKTLERGGIVYSADRPHEVAQVETFGDAYFVVTDSFGMMEIIDIVQPDFPVSRLEFEYSFGLGEEVPGFVLEYYKQKTEFLEVLKRHQRSVMVQTGEDGILLTYMAENGRDWFCEWYEKGEKLHFWGSHCPKIFTLYGKYGWRKCRKLVERGAQKKYQKSHRERLQKEILSLPWEKDMILVKGLWWHVIGRKKYKGQRYYLLEEVEYGGEVPYFLVREDLEVIYTEVWNGFEDLEPLVTHYEQEKERKRLAYEFLQGNLKEED